MYDRRQASRDRARTGLLGLAERLGAKVESDFVTSSCRFLVEHWPDRAPQLLLLRQSDAPGRHAEHRLSLVGDLDGCPLLIHASDFLELRAGHIDCSALVVLAAAPLKWPPTDSVEARADLPFRMPPRKATVDDLRESEPCRRLSDHGFEVTWTRAGVAAIHRGPATALFEEEKLLDIARAVVGCCREAPAGAPTRLASAPDPLDRTKLELVMQAFLEALRDNRPLDVLACAHPLLFSTLSMEPSPAELIETIERARARPVWWGAVGEDQPPADARRRKVSASSRGQPSLNGLHRTYGGHDHVNIALAANFGGGTAHMNVCLRRVAGEWTVSGYLARRTVVLGVDHPNDG